MPDGHTVYMHDAMPVAAGCTTFAHDGHAEWINRLLWLIRQRLR